MGGIGILFALIGSYLGERIQLGPPPKPPTELAPRPVIHHVSRPTDGRLISRPSTSSASAARRTGSTPRSCSASREQARASRSSTDAERGRGHRRQHLRLHRRGQEGVDRHHPRAGRAQEERQPARSSSSPAASRQRYPNELADEMPEVDHFLGSSDMLKLERVLDAASADAHARRQPRRLGHSARAIRAALDTASAQRLREDRRGLQPHLRVLRHPAAPRQAALAPADDVVREVEQLVAQRRRSRSTWSRRTPSPTAATSSDERATLAELVAARRRRDGPALGAALLSLPGDDRRRADRAPRAAPARRALRRHAAAARGRRACCGACAAATADSASASVVERLRARVPSLIFRTAFIVGHPGETDADFDELCELRRVGGVRSRRRLPATRTRRARAASSCDGKVPRQGRAPTR